MIEALLPPDVTGVAWTDDVPPTPLHPEERALVAAMSEPRRVEFERGRACARAALAKLGIAPQPILRGDDRSPIWPDGIVGSLSHTEGLCAAVVARSSTVAALGVDVEHRGPKAAGALARVFDEAERAHLADLAVAEPDIDWTRLGFSAKESVYKAHYTRCRTKLRFHDVTLRFDAVRQRFAAGIAAPNADSIAAEGRFASLPGFALTFFVMRRGDEEAR